MLITLLAKRMKIAAAHCPKITKVACAIIVGVPIAYTILSLRLLFHPANADGWIVLGVFSIPYASGAFFLLRGFGSVRWIWAILVSLSVVSGISLLPQLFHHEYWDVFVLSISAMALKALSVVLLFLPRSNVFFASKLERKQWREPFLLGIFAIWTFVIVGVHDLVRLTSDPVGGAERSAAGRFFLFFGVWFVPIILYLVFCLFWPRTQVTEGKGV